MSKSLSHQKGRVISKSGDKTVKVLLSKKKKHPKYNKIIVVSSSFLVHDEKNLAKLGDTVQFVPCRPLSATKKWRLISVLGSEQ